MKPKIENILKEGDIVSIRLAIDSPNSLPTVRVVVGQEKNIDRVIDFQPALGTTGVFEFLSFKVGKKKRRIRFPLEIDSMELAFPPVFKATFKKRKSD